MTAPNLVNNPDAPHAYQPRKVTWRGKRRRARSPRYHGWEYAIEDHPSGVVRTMYEDRLPCRHCGGSEQLPIHNGAAS